MFLAPFPDPTDYAEKLDVSKLPCESSCSYLDDSLPWE